MEVCEFHCRMRHLRIREGLADRVVHFSFLAATAPVSRDVNQAKAVALPRMFCCLAKRFLVEVGVTLEMATTTTRKRRSMVRG